MNYFQNKKTKKQKNNQKLIVTMRKQKSVSYIFMRQNAANLSEISENKKRGERINNNMENYKHFNYQLTPVCFRVYN